MQIVDFRPELAPAFKALNEEWIARFYKLEPQDQKILGDPQHYILDRGGYVLFAQDRGEVVGCCALTPMGDGGFEIGKMAVHESRRGEGIGRALLQACVDRARSLKSPRLYLESGSALTPALSLYRSFGFRDLTTERRPVSSYTRADVWMELRLPPEAEEHKPAG